MARTVSSSQEPKKLPYKFYGEEQNSKIKRQYKLSELRKLLENKTWEQVIDATIYGREFSGVYFSGRIGKFMNQMALAVVAFDRIVVMKFLNSKITPFTFHASAILNGSHNGGFLLCKADFMSRHTGDIKLTDLVVLEENDDNAATLPNRL
jgi:hypothetical protein